MDGLPVTNCAHWPAGRGVRVPEPVAASRVAAVATRSQERAARPVAYTMHPWVVANDRIKAAGWTPTYTNEEAYVAGHRPTPWATVSPQRRQEIALAGLVALVVGVVVGAVALIRRRGRRRVVD